VAPSEPFHTPQASAAGRFANTRRSLVAAARNGRSPQAKKALASLCEIYWYPLYAYARHGTADENRPL
jgi:hypothetical protein